MKIDQEEMMLESSEPADLDPLALFHEDWNAARAAQDPTANLATIASVNRAGEPEARTLILRELAGELAIFFNQTSPKWDEFRNSRTIAVHVYWPSRSAQYRLRCTHRYVPAALVHESWTVRPLTPKQLDWLYTTHQPQSSPVADPQTLQTMLRRLPIEEPLQAPATAIGFYLTPERLERLEISADGHPHNRWRYERTDSGWSFSHLVP